MRSSAAFVSRALSNTTVVPEGSGGCPCGDTLPGAAVPGRGWTTNAAASRLEFCATPGDASKHSTSVVDAVANTAHLAPRTSHPIDRPPASYYAPRWEWFAECVKRSLDLALSQPECRRH